MISDRDLVSIHLKGSVTQGAPILREIGERWLRTSVGRKGGWELIDVQSCICCGAPGWPNGRCGKHQDRNPCAVEGCTCTARANGRLSPDWHICSKHWRSYVPPRSPERQVIQRFFRVAKKMGFARNDRWPLALERRYARYCSGLVSRVRRQSTEGSLDQAKIEKMFGWDGE